MASSLLSSDLDVEVLGAAPAWRGQHVVAGGLQLENIPIEGLEVEVAPRTANLAVVDGTHTCGGRPGGDIVTDLLHIYMNSFSIQANELPTNKKLTWYFFRNVGQRGERVHSRRRLCWKKYWVIGNQFLNYINRNVMLIITLPMEHFVHTTVPHSYAGRQGQQQQPLVSHLYRNVEEDGRKVQAFILERKVLSWQVREWHSHHVPWWFMAAGPALCPIYYHRIPFTYLIWRARLQSIQTLSGQSPHVCDGDVSTMMVKAKKTQT